MNLSTTSTRLTRNNDVQRRRYASPVDTVQPLVRPERPPYRICAFYSANRQNRPATVSSCARDTEAVFNAIATFYSDLIERIDWSVGVLIYHPHCLGEDSIPLESDVVLPRWFLNHHRRLNVVRNRASEGLWTLSQNTVGRSPPNNVAGGRVVDSRRPGFSSIYNRFELQESTISTACLERLKNLCFDI